MTLANTGQHYNRRVGYWRHLRLANSAQAMTSIHSPHPPQECLRRIEGSFDARLGRTILFAPPGRVLGRVDGDTFKVVFMGWTPASYERSAPTSYPRLVFVGRVTADEGGSMLMGDWSRTPIRSFFTIWFGGIALALVVTLVNAAATVSRSPTAAIWPLMFAGMLLFGYRLFKQVRRVQDADAEAIVDLLVRAVGSESAPNQVRRRGRRESRRNWTRAARSGEVGDSTPVE